MRRKSRDSGADTAVPTEAEAHTLALGWLGLRELSAAQLRQRLRRRGVAADAAERILQRLTASGVLDEARLARAAVRRETTIRGRGPARARSRLRAMGLSDDTTTKALDDVLRDVDLGALLDRAIDKRLRGHSPGRLDPAARRRLVAALVRQGFDLGTVLARLRRRGASVEDVD